MSAYAQITRRYRSTGAARAEVVAALASQGLNADDAEKLIDEVDRELAQSGRTLPDDVSATVRADAPEREVGSVMVAASPATAPVTKSEGAPGDAPIEVLRERKLLVDVAFAQLRKSGNQELARQEVAERASAAIDVDEVMGRANVRFDQVAARERRDAARAKHSSPVQAKKQGSPWGVVWIILGLAMIVMGLAVGRVQSLLIGGITIFHGIKSMDL